MKHAKYIYLLVFIVVVGVTSCSESDANQAIAEFGTSEGVSTTCFDYKMDQWYASFEKYQAAGYTMEVADKKAVFDAVQACQACMEK